MKVLECMECDNAYKITTTHRKCQCGGSLVIINWLFGSTSLEQIESLKQ